MYGFEQRLLAARRAVGVAAVTLCAVGALGCGNCGDGGDGGNRGGSAGATPEATPVADDPGAEPANSVGMVDGDWDAFAQDLIEATFAARPMFAVQSGRHEFDGQVPDLSEAGIAAELQRIEAALARARAFDPAALTAERAFERDYVIAQLEGERFQLVDLDRAHQSPFLYMQVLDPDAYLTRDYAPLAERMRAFTALARQVPQVVAHIQANLRTPMPRPHASLGRQMSAGLASFYKTEAPAVFAEVTDEALTAKLTAATAAASDALSQLARWFATEQKRGTADYALGAEKFAAMLAATERVTTPLDELEAIGRADLDRNLAALKQACAEIAPGGSIRSCVAKVGADKPPDGPVAEARRQIDELEGFVRERDLVSIPGPERAKVEESPPYNRWNAAYISIPGPYEKNLPSIYYIAPPDPSWSRADRLAYIPGRKDLLFTSIHEVWPGHFLQFLHAKRVRSRFGQLFVGYAFAEGWAHYTEEMMWEAGVAEGDPEAHVGQLLNALLRDARFLSAIGLHARGMTVAESEKLFRDKAFQDPGNARQQAARGTFDPGYLNYTMGKLMIRKLRGDWTASRGGRQAWKAFHDELLSYGGPPLPLVRAAMLGDADDGDLF